MAESTIIATIRYGYGFAPMDQPPAGMVDLMAGLNPQRPLISGAGMSTAASLELFRKFRLARRTGGQNSAGVKKLRKQMRGAFADVLRQRVMDALTPQSGFRERLVDFWADHFAISARKSRLSALLAGAFVEEAIRANITRDFPTMLKAVIQHPAMLEYLDQNASVGPASRFGRKKNRGLNENLARELLELHTLGVGGAYRQKDVRQLAELLTGLTFRKTGFTYIKHIAEPGAEHVLGRVYGGNRERLDHILAFLDDVARHPDTAQHIARKLVRHFISDTPDKRYVAQVADVFLKSEGDFISTYEALLDHQNAWVPLGGKVKRPYDFVISGLRSFGVNSSDIQQMSLKDGGRIIASPLALMGQRFMQPLGPDGWPEAAEHWITPQGLAARIQWASFAAQKYGAGLDPRDYVIQTLQAYASPKVILAAKRAATRTEGLTLVMASPDFNRR